MKITSLLENQKKEKRIAITPETAKKYIRPDQWTWLIVGDVKEIQAKIEALDIGEVIVLD